MSIELLLLTVYTLALVVLSMFGLYGLIMVLAYRRLKPRDPESVPIPSDASLPRVTIQLPLYNERYVVRRLIDAVCRLDYPRDRLEIQVLDDSTDDTVELSRSIAEEWSRRGVSVEVIHRTDRVGYKAGALREGLARASGEFVAIFDADFVPTESFLRSTIPHLLADPRVGMVQTRWEHLNSDYSLLTRIQAMALDAHFAMEQQVRNRSAAFINFNGTAGVWRADCIRDAGDWEDDTLTEDLDLSYRAQLKGWKFLYLNEVSVPAELPAEVNALKTQQFRWTKGAIETARKHLVNVWRSAQPLRVKLHATIHLTANFVFPLILLVALLNVPIVLVKAANPEYDLIFNLMGIFIVASISSFLFYMNAQRDLRSDWRRRILLFPLFMAGTMGMSVNNSRAVAQAVFGRRTPFLRTPKYNIVGRGGNWQSSLYRLSRIDLWTLLELGLTLYFVVAIFTSLYLAELAALPFQILYLIGFGSAGYLSLKHALASERA